MDYQEQQLQYYEGQPPRYYNYDDGYYGWPLLATTTITAVLNRLMGLCGWTWRRRLTPIDMLLIRLVGELMVSGHSDSG